MHADDRPKLVLIVALEGEVVAVLDAATEDAAARLADWLGASSVRRQINDLLTSAAGLGAEAA